MCSFKFPTSETTLLMVVVKEIISHFPELKKLDDLISAVEKGAKSGFFFFLIYKLLIDERVIS